MKVFVSDVQFLSSHGVTDSERLVGHRFRLDLVALVDETASLTDHLKDTLDYADMANVAVNLCNQHPCHTVEFACERIGNGLLSKFPRITEVSVRLSKLQPAIPLQVGSVGVEKLYTRSVRGSDPGSSR
jgi:dihydroneopterin aldolase